MEAQFLAGNRKASRCGRGHAHFVAGAVLCACWRWLRVVVEVNVDVTLGLARGPVEGGTACVL